MAAKEYDSKGRSLFRNLIDPNNVINVIIRQNLIKEIEENVGGALMTYTANLGSPAAGILPFNNMVEGHIKMADSQLFGKIVTTPQIL